MSRTLIGDVDELLEDFGRQLQSQIFSSGSDYWEGFERMNSTTVTDACGCSKSVDISVCFDVLSLSELQIRSFEESEMEGNGKPVRANRLGGSGVCVRDSLQFSRNYSWARKHVKILKY